MKTIIQKYTVADAEDMSYGEVTIPFWKAGRSIDPGIFCQWFICKFHDDEHTYVCTEQYMMYQKAKLFNDTVTSEKILREKNPAKMKALGREIKNFSDAVWNKNKFSIVYTGNFLKFSQNPELKKYLKSTGNAILVETSPYDTVWGIGMSADNDNINIPESWKGQNLLGFALMQVRDDI